MTDLEDALRRELRDQADMAEEEAAPGGLLAGVIADYAHRASRRRLLAAGAAGLTVVVLAGAVLTARALGGGAPASGPRPMPLAVTALTPPGWAPVPYLGAQLSVPASWFVEISGGTNNCGTHVPGMIFVGQAPTKRWSRDMGCRVAANLVVLTRFQSQPSPSTVIAVHLNAVVNGIRVATSRRAGGQELVIAPSLGIQVTARGPLAGRILATLTRSPMAVAMERGPAPLTPGNWRRQAFGGISFAAPTTWVVERDDQWGGCGFIASRTVRLTTASVLFTPSCLPVPDTAGSSAAQPGVVVGAGRYATLGLTPASYGNCRRIHDLRACVLSQNTARLLTIAAFPAGARQPTIVEIGLAGSGAVARTILDSIKPGRA